MQQARFWTHWDSIVLDNGVLKQLLESDDGTESAKELLNPTSKKSEMLQQLHEDRAGDSERDQELEKSREQVVLVQHKRCPRLIPKICCLCCQQWTTTATKGSDVAVKPWKFVRENRYRYDNGLFQQMGRGICFAKSQNRHRGRDLLVPLEIHSDQGKHLE